MVGDLLIHFL